MALSLKFNGRASQNLITASWFNDFYNLFTGSMTDQIITFKTDVLVKAIGAAPVSSATLALAAGSALGIGQYGYVLTFVDANGGETLAGGLNQITTTSGNQAINLTSITTGPTGTVSRNLYRTKVGAPGVYYRLSGALPNNTTTTYSDTTPDASLSTIAPPLHPSFGGSLSILDPNSNVTLLIHSDGAFKGNGLFKAFGGAPSAGPTLALAAGSSLSVGAYRYEVTFLSATGESIASPFTSITTTTGNQNVNLSAIPTGPLGTTGRKIYRTSVGGTVNYWLIATLADNSTTTYSDTTSDANLGVTNPPTAPTFGGAIIIKDQNDVQNGIWTSDGNLSASNITLLASSPQVVGSTANGIILTSPGGGILNPIRSANGGTLLYNYSTSLGFQFRLSNGTILAEIRQDGNMIIGGNTYYTHASTFNNAANQAFSGFDIAECYQTDATYPAGTVVVLDPVSSLLTKCTADGHPLAHVIVDTPGYCIGTPDPANKWQPVSLVGRVLVNTAVTITAGQKVCADNNGGVRPMAAGEWKDMLGIAINNSSNGQVGIILRPCYAQG